MAKIAAPKKESNKKLSTESQQEQIQRLAYQFFVERGCQHGHDREDWMRAEAIVRNSKF